MASLQLQTMLFIFLWVIFLVVGVTNSHILSKNSLLNNSSSKQDGLVLNLIHRDLIYPQTYAPNSTLSDQIDVLLSGYAPPSSQQDYDPNTVPINYRDGQFFLEILIGSRSVHQNVAFSTRYPFIWVQCAEGQSRGGNPVFDPTDSTTYVQSTCLPDRQRGDYCNKLPGEERGRPGGRCDSRNRCEYTMHSTDGSSTKGYIGFDKITFIDAHRRQANVPEVLIGCGHGGERMPAHANGVFGLGGVRDLSILKHLTPKFSFCFGSLSRPHAGQSLLAIGQDAQLRGNPLPFTFNGYLYQIPVNRISFGRDTITPNELTFTIDTMSKFSYVNRAIYNQIRSKVEQAVGNRMRKVIVKKFPDALCYTAPKLVHPFPDLVLHLYRNTIVLDVNSLFLKAPDKNAYCLTFTVSSDNNENVIGATALQHYNVGFDWNNNQAFFQKN